MTYNEFKRLLNKASDSYQQIPADNTFLGLQLIRKYLPHADIEGADHDIVYSVDVERLLEAGITKEDAEKLGQLNWMIDDDEYLACYV